MKKPHIRKFHMFWEVVFPAQPDPLMNREQFQWIPAWCKDWEDVAAVMGRMAKHAPTWEKEGQAPKYYADSLPASVRRA